MAGGIPDDPIQCKNIENALRTNECNAHKSSQVEEAESCNEGFIDRLYMCDWEPTGPDLKQIKFFLKDGNHFVSLWNGLQVDDNMFVEVPNGELAAGTRECFVTLLEYAEEKLEMSNIFLCVPKSRNDRGELLRSFMFLGFEVVHSSNCSLIPPNDMYVFMAYAF